MANKEPKTINEIILELAPLKPTFPNLVKLMQLALKTVVSTAECEWLFSALKQIKSYLYMKMGMCVCVCVCSMVNGLARPLPGHGQKFGLSE